MRERSKKTDPIDEDYLSLRAEDAVYALRTLAIEPYTDFPTIEPKEGETPLQERTRRHYAELEWRGRRNYQQEALGRLVRLLSSQVETLNRWIEELPADDPHLEVIRELARNLLFE